MKKNFPGKTYFGESFDMNEGQAMEVRYWRTVLHYTWRQIAARWSSEYGPDHGHNQLYGMDVCDKAATILHENMYDDLWNGGLD